jgi:hypothetical protein
MSLIYISMFVSDHESRVQRHRRRPQRQQQRERHHDEQEVQQRPVDKGGHGDGRDVHILDGWSHAVHHRLG